MENKLHLFFIYIFVSSLGRIMEPVLVCKRVDVKVGQYVSETPEAVYAVQYSLKVVL